MSRLAGTPVAPSISNVRRRRTGSARGNTLDRHAELDRFLAGVERRAFRMAEIAVGNREDALDILQDAMATLVGKYRDRGTEEWGPLFTRILQSRIEDWRRREYVRRRFRVWFGRGEEADGDPLEAVGDAGEPGPERRAQADRSLEQLEAAIRALPLRQQQALMLRVWEGLDVGETARAMRCSEGSVKTHYSRAVTTLRAQLEGHWP